MLDASGANDHGKMLIETRGATCKEYIRIVSFRVKVQLKSQDLLLREGCKMQIPRLVIISFGVQSRTACSSVEHTKKEKKRRMRGFKHSKTSDPQLFLGNCQF